MSLFILTQLCVCFPFFLRRRSRAFEGSRWRRHAAQNTAPINTHNTERAQPPLPPNTHTPPPTKQAAQPHQLEAHAAPQGRARRRRQGGPQDGRLGHVQDQLHGPAHHDRVVQAQRGADREGLQQVAHRQVPLGDGRRLAVPLLSRQSGVACFCRPSEWASGGGSGSGGGGRDGGVCEEGREGGGLAAAARRRARALKSPCASASFLSSLSRGRLPRLRAPPAAPRLSAAACPAKRGPTRELARARGAGGAAPAFFRGPLVFFCFGGERARAAALKRSAREDAGAARSLASCDAPFFFIFSSIHTQTQLFAFLFNSHYILLIVTRTLTRHRQTS